MNKLTYDRNGTEPKIYDCCFLDTSKCIQKLGQLEDIETKLGMPLDKFFKALDGSTHFGKVYVKHPHKGLQEMFLSGFECHNETARWFNAFNLECGSCTLGLSSYGKTWAFTKEELKKW